MTTTMPQTTAPSTAEPGSGAAAESRSGRLGWRRLGMYGVGGLAEEVATFGLSNMLLFYLTIACGMSGSLAGAVLGTALILDGISAPIIGSLSDNSRSKFGRRHPMMAIGAVLMAVSYGLLFSIPEGLTGVPLFAYAVTMLVSLRVAHDLFTVPYAALGAEITDDYHERSMVVVARNLCSKGSMWISTFLAYGVFLTGEDGLIDRAAYIPFAWCSAGISLVMAAVCILGTLDMRDRLHVTPAKQRFSLTRFPVEVAELFRNPSFRALFAMIVTFMMAWGTVNSLGLHVKRYFWHLTTEQILTVQMVGVAGGVTGIFLVGALRRVVEKRTLGLLGMGLCAACQLVVVPLWLTGLLPPEAVFATVTVTAACTSGGLAMTLASYSSMMADVTDRHEQLFGTRREGLLYSGASLGTKVSIGLGAMVAGVALDVIGFPTGVSKTHQPPVPAETLHNLGLAYGPGAGLLILVAMTILVTYRLSKSQHDAIRVDLAGRRRTEEGEG